MNNWYLITKLYNIINDICFDFSEKNIIIIYEIKRSVGGNYEKRNHKRG